MSTWAQCMINEMPAERGAAVSVCYEYDRLCKANHVSSFKSKQENDEVCFYILTAVVCLTTFKCFFFHNF